MSQSVLLDTDVVSYGFNRSVFKRESSFLVVPTTPQG